MFRIPYRWTRSTIGTNLGSCYWDLRNGIINIFKWLPVIWFDQDWDWSYLATIMEFKLRNMSKSAEHWSTLSHKVHQRRMLVCAEILKRLDKDEYWDNMQKVFADKKHAALMAEIQSKGDQKYFGILIGKYMREWWG
ncbi:MAG: hypothetical protein KGI50_06085 [Patescibacteria group bacterium]|nr:hypothetical protein [Patescibacteria group bacterium]MDE2439089.1 hypothetical protein [Patescibacteria group bacterium]